MWVVLLINTLVAAFLAFFSFRNRHEAFNLFNAGIVFIVFGLVLLISAIPVFKDFDTSSVLMFTAGLLLIVGIIMLIVSWVTKSERAVRIKDIAVTLAVAAVCSIYIIRNLSMINVIVPELAMFLAIALFAVGLNKN
ncbi:hypothetical protein [Lactobacillus amylovorus]